VGAKGGKKKNAVRRSERPWEMSDSVFRTCTVAGDYFAGTRSDNKEARKSFVAS